MTSEHSGSPRKIRRLSKHSFSNDVFTNSESGRKFSNINTQAVIYNNEELQQLYTGLYLDDNLHNVGTYRWLAEDCSSSHKYDGKFFLNNMHGYGVLSYPNDAYYEGLFYFNKRLGPGVITYNNGTQDVGLWNGNDLIRLCDKFSISDYYKENIPKLSGLLQSKFYLLQFKHLIPITEKYKDPAKEILTKLGAPDTVIANKRALYSEYVRNTNSIFLNGEKLYKNFFSYEEELYTTIDVVDHLDENGNPVIIKLEVRNLVAWNNEEINTVILKHAFINRQYEKLLSYKVKDVLCAKKRGPFLPPGPLETRCRKLFFACRSKEPRRIRRIITEYNVYPDVADCRGNNTVTYATLANKCQNIKVLSEFGANLNNFNDDCVTPLIFGILQYISIVYDITNSVWESAFIYSKAENDFPACNQQWPVQSASSFQKNSIASSQFSFHNMRMRDSVNSGPDVLQLHIERSLQIENDAVVKPERRESLISLVQEYVFPLECVHTKRGSYARKTMDPNAKSKKSINITDVAYNRFKMFECTKIMQTISTLLLCGANANIGEVPFCPIITAIFSKSKDLIQMLISFNANVNAKTSEYHGKLGPLHVIASLSPCLEQLEMAFTFLENGAYVDDLSNRIHWLEEHNILLADQSPVDQLEKTPLHLICMRYDFMEDTKKYLVKLALLFLQYGANLNLKYIGHTPLTLAMIRGNTILMENLLETGIVDPNEGLGYNMGVPLTMCALHRYNKIFTSSIVHHLYSILEQFYANPFNDVPNFIGNAIEFFYEQNTFRTPKRSSLEKQTQGTLLMNYAKCTLLRYIESKVVQTIYNYKILCDFDSPLYSAIIKYLNHSKTCKILRILIDHDQIIVNGPNLEKLLLLVDKKQPNKMTFEKSDEKYPIFHFENYMPELDPDDSKYVVCFQCFRKTNEILMKCPKCEMVYFCSQECNIKNEKEPDSGHPCKGKFYDNEMIVSQSSRKRLTKFDQILQKSLKLQKLLSLGDMDLDEYGKMSAKEKKKSLAKIKKKREEQKASDNAVAIEEGNLTLMKSSRKGKSKTPDKASKGDKKDQREKLINKKDQREKSINKKDQREKSINKDNQREKSINFLPHSADDKGKTALIKDDGKSTKSNRKTNDDDDDDETKADTTKEQNERIEHEEKTKRNLEERDVTEEKTNRYLDEGDVTEEKTQSNLEEGDDTEEEKLKKAGMDRLKSLHEQQAKLLKSTAGEQDENETSKTGAGQKKGKKENRKIDTGKSIRFSNEVQVEPDRQTEKSRRRKSKSAGSGKSRKTSNSSDNESISKSKKKSKSSRASSKLGSETRRSREASSRTSSTDFGENRYRKVNINLKKNVVMAANSVKRGLSVFIGSKKPVIDMDKRNMYLKLRAQMLERDRELNARKSVTAENYSFPEKLKMDKHCTERMLQLARQKIPKLSKDFEELDVKFWQLFSPYCIYQNGQLYYNFNEENSNEYYKITYSSV